MMRSDATLRFGYIDVAVTSSRIYGLYSGRTRNGNGGNASFGWQVHVFDWSGKLIDVIDVEQDLIAIAVNADDSTLYGVSHDPTPAVLSWSLDSPIRLAGVVIVLMSKRVNLSIAPRRIRREAVRDSARAEDLLRPGVTTPAGDVPDSPDASASSGIGERARWQVRTDI